MKHVVLTDEESKILEAIEKGEYVSVKNLSKEKKDAIDAVQNTLNKTKNINIRLTMRDIQKLKARAVENGLAYQTLIAAILRQYATRKIDGKF
ncbi:MAG: hypothetical protein V1697_02895 [Candidatus Levyibacteriota bacterium]